jgi:hypothetical protein
MSFLYSTYSKVSAAIKTANLSLTEWVAVGLAAAFAALVTALKIQGGLLHKAQVQLLQQKFIAAEAKTGTLVYEDRAKYQKALTDFTRAGGKLILLLSLLVAAHPPALAESTGLLTKCENALSACNSLVDAEDAQVRQLKHEVAEWKKQAGEGSQASILTTATASGAVTGCLVGLGAGGKGALGGASLGAITGLAIGLIVEEMK